MVPERGSEVKMWPSAWLASWAAICASSALIWVLRLASTAARARVTWALAAPCSPVAPRGAEVSRWQRSAGLVRPLWLAAFSQAASRLSDSQPARSWQAGAGQEGQADGRVQLAEQADCAGVGGLQVGAQLVAGRDPVADQVLAGAAGLAQREGGRAVGDQRPQPGPVGAQHVGEHVGVEAVILVARPRRLLRPEAKLAGLHAGQLRAQPGPECPSTSAGVRGCMRRSSPSWSLNSGTSEALVHDQGVADARRRVSKRGVQRIPRRGSSPKAGRGSTACT